MSFLPEEDQEFLDSNGITHELLTEEISGNKRRAILLPQFAFDGSLRTHEDGALAVCEHCDLLVLVPDGYATTKLDSFYTSPRLKRLDGSDPPATGGENTLFQRSWQFWSRHVDDKDWRVGIDGLRTYLSYIRGELRNA